jgi:hypothetical protein
MFARVFFIHKGFKKSYILSIFTIKSSDFVARIIVYVAFFINFSFVLFTLNNDVRTYFPWWVQREGTSCYKEGKCF